MAANFKISVHRDRDTMNLKLMGDFDGTSACELLNLLRESCYGISRVFVNTSGLKDIYPFGQDTFQNNLYVLKSKPTRLLFIGKKATQIAPERSQFCEIL